MSPHVSKEFVPAGQLAAAHCWLPSYFTGSHSIALRAGFTGQTVHELGAQVLEGWRVSETPSTLDYSPLAASTPVYRQANIKPLRLHLDSQHWTSPEIEGRWCLRPGDVVLNKLAPVRAAFVSPAAKRHPADGNTLIVRNLARVEAVWVALCLNHSGYERLLLLGSGVLDRVGKKALAALRVPPVPPEMGGLSARLRDALDEQTLASEALHHARNEANEVTGAARTTTRPLRSGVFFTPDAMTDENWLPKATALRAEQASLTKELGWAEIAELATGDDRARLSYSPEGARALHLRDVGDDLFVTPIDEGKKNLVPSRTLARPLVPGEVLLSTLGSSFRVAYVDDEVPQNTFPTDGWVRVRFRETPAAWALLLSTDALRSQAARLAVGSVQQFVPPEALRSLRVPVPPREVRERWQRAVERHHAQRRTQDRQWVALVTEMNAVFESVHRPFAETRSHIKVPIE